MILVVQSAKMTVSRRENPAIQVNGEPPLNFLQIMTRMVRFEDSPRKKRISDLLVVLIAVPLLITSSILLHSSMRTDWVRNVALRWRILGLGLSLLFVSLLVCLYATHRLGLCVWGTAQAEAQTTARIRRRTISSRSTGLPIPLVSTDSQMQLMCCGELPPSYDSVIRSHDLPPPYCTLIVQDEKTEITRSPSPFVATG